MKTRFTILLSGLIFFLGTSGFPQLVNPDDYPAAGREEWGQLMWNLQLANQQIGDFTNFMKVDDQGVSACRYTLAFSVYFLAAEQYYKFPAWREAIQPASDRLIQKMLRKEIWGYWSHESMGITKFEPNMDRPYPQNNDPVSLGNIMYSGHLGMMINLYQMIYHDLKWDRPGSIVFVFDSTTRFVYDNRSLQEVMFLQMMHNPVPGIECERNAIFPACNTHPMISWKIYDKMHNTRYFEAAHSAFDPWFEKIFINPRTQDMASFYLIKQGWAFSGWNPKYGNKMDEVMAEMVKKGVDFNSGGNDGWIGTFMHAWNPELIDKLYPHLKKKHYKDIPKGMALLTKDVVAPDCYYGFFCTLAAETGDEAARNALLRTVDSIYSPVWTGNTYHYPFMDKVPTVNLAAADGDKKPDTSAQKPASQQNPGTNGSGLCCKSTQVKGHGDICNMKSFPPHSDLADRLIALSRALPSKGLYNMIANPPDAEYLSEPAITGVDTRQIILKRAVFDRTKKALVVSTIACKGAGNSAFSVVNLDPAKSYQVLINNKLKETITKTVKYSITLDAAKDHDIVIKEI